MSYYRTVKITRVKIPRFIKPLNSPVFAIIKIITIIKIINIMISEVEWGHFDVPTFAIRTNQIRLKVE